MHKALSTLAPPLQTHGGNCVLLEAQLSSAPSELLPIIILLQSQKKVSKLRAWILCIHLV